MEIFTIQKYQPISSRKLKLQPKTWSSANKGATLSIIAKMVHSVMFNNVAESLFI